MTREEFLTKLEQALAALPYAERRDALNYYEEYFDSAGPENEAQTIADLGSPEEVARSILESSTEPAPDAKTESKAEKAPKSKKASAKKKKPYFTAFDYKVLFVAAVALLLCKFGTTSKSTLVPSSGSASSQPQTVVSASVSSDVSSTETSDPTTTENYFNAASNEPSDFTITVPVSDLQDMLELEFDYGNVMFKTAPVSTENATFEFKDFPPAYVEQDSPAEHHTRICCILPNFSNVSNQPKPLLTITLPENALNKLKVRFGTGGLDLGDMTLNDLTAQLNTGRLYATSLTASNVTARLNTGSLHVTSLTAPNVKLDFETGSLDIETLDCKTAEINNETGSVTIGLVRNADDFTLTNSTGRNDVTLECSPADYNINAQCETGKLEVDGVTYKKKSYTSSSSSGRHVNITDTTGRITVSFQE